MGTEFDNEHTSLFDIILNEYDIKNEDRLKRCIRNVLTNRGNNRYLSQLEYDYEVRLGIEPRSRDSKSRVITITLADQK